MIELPDAATAAEAKSAIASGKLTPEDKKELSDAVAAFEARTHLLPGEETPKLASLEDDEPQTMVDAPASNWVETESPTAEEAAPIAAAAVQSLGEAEGLQDAMDSGALDDAPQGMWDSLKKTVSGWFGDEEEPAGEPAPGPEAPAGGSTGGGWHPVTGERIPRVAAKEQFIDESKSSLSQDTRFYAPPQYFAPGNPMMTARTHFEPNVANVEAMLADNPDLRTLVGAKKDESVEEGSKVYKKVADLLYRQAYLDSKRAGNTIVRYSQVKDSLPGWLQGMMWANENIIVPAAQTVLSADRTATGGLGANLLGGAVGGSELQNQLTGLREAAHPALGTAGAIGGAMLPGGLAAGLAKGAAGLPGLATGLASKSLLPRVAAGAGVGAAASAAEGAIQDLGDVALTDTDYLTPAQFAARRAVDAMSGSLFGAGGKLLEEGGTAAANALRRKHRGLPTIEAAGGGTSLLGGGLKLPASMKAREKAYDARGSRGASVYDLDVPDEVGQATASVMPRIERAGRGRRGQLIDSISADNLAFYGSPAGQKLVAPKPLWDKAVELMRRKLEPMAGGNNAEAIEDAFAQKIKIQESLGRMTVGKLVPASAAGKVPTMSMNEAKEIFGAAFVRKLQDANQAGPGAGKASQSGARDVDLEGWTPRSSKGGVMRVDVAPKAVNAERFERWIDTIQDEAKVWKKRTGSDISDKMWAELHAAGMESRRGISPEWEKTKAKHSELLGRMKRTLEEAGLPPEIGRSQVGEMGHRALSVDETKKLESYIRGAYDTQGKNVTATRALRDLSSDSDMLKQLLEVAAHREAAAIRGGQGVTAGLAMSGGRPLRAFASIGPEIWDSARLRSDPLIRAYVRNWHGLGAAGATDENDAQALSIGLDMAKAIDQKRKQPNEQSNR